MKYRIRVLSQKPGCLQLTTKFNQRSLNELLENNLMKGIKDFIPYKCKPIKRSEAEKFLARPKIEWPGAMLLQIFIIKFP